MRTFYLDKKCDSTALPPEKLMVPPQKNVDVRGPSDLRGSVLVTTGYERSTTRSLKPIV